MKNRLIKSNNKVLCGVLAGIAEYIGLDPVVLRVIYAVLTLFCACFPGIILYFVLAILIPTYKVHHYNRG